MKLNKLFIAFSFAGLLSGCDYLDFDESQGKTKEEAYAYFENIKSLANAAYRKLPSDFGAIGGALRESATDNSTFTWESNAVYKMYNNTWSPLNLIDNQWGNYYEVIHDINSFFENYSEENLQRYAWSSNYEEEIKKARMYSNELVVLRALYYFELVKRYKDVPLLKNTLTPEEANKVKKTPFNEVIAFIVQQCDSVANSLPTDHASFFEETGRVTKGAAMAIKARALLYAASPLFSEGQDEMKGWEAAARASMDIIKTGIYSLPNIDNDPLYNKEGGNNLFKSKQMIFETRGGENNSFEARNLPIGFKGFEISGGNTPTQNLVDAFETKNGYSVKLVGNTWVTDAPDFDQTKPYANRDPRFYKNIMYNGDTFMEEKVETFAGGKHGLPTDGATLTGYYMKKLINETVNLSPTNNVKKFHHYPSYRYAEVLLNYAEAMNEWKGPDYSDGEFHLSARAALNQVRKAANMPDVKAANQDEFREKVRNERRVELAFEGHRFWDIRRWKIGDVVKEIYGVEIQNNGGTLTYTAKKIQDRVWEDKMYLYPIPQKEVYINPENLTQNPGWEINN